MVKRVYIKAKKYFAKKCATNLLACSNEAGIELYGAKIFREEGKVIKNGIDVDKFLLVSQGDADVLRKKFDLESKGPVIGNITRFEKAKNQKFVLEIFNLVLKQYPSAVLILGGVDGGTLSEIKAKIDEMKLNDNVRLIGVRTDIPICLKLIDVYLFPSLREGLPITVMEIQAAGKYCVLSDIVPKEADMGIGALEYVDLSKSAEIWAEKIIEVFENKRYIQADAIKEKFIEKGYDIRVSCSELEKIYSKATLH